MFPSNVPDADGACCEDEGEGSNSHTISQLKVNTADFELVFSFFLVGNPAPLFRHTVPLLHILLQTVLVHHPPHDCSTLRIHFFAVVVKQIPAIFIRYAWNGWIKRILAEFLFLYYCLGLTDRDQDGQYI